MADEQQPQLGAETQEDESILRLRTVGVMFQPGVPIGEDR
jgi:hypothetical protein